MALLNDITVQAALDVATLASNLAALTGGVAHGAVFGNGEILTPGVYDVGSAAALQGILTLDAQGDSTALFVIRTVGALDSVAGSQVLLAGGASAANVFWRAEGAIGLGANTTFVGTAIGVSGATNQGAASTMNGRLLSTAGAVNIDSSALSVPTGASSLRLGVLSTFAMFSANGAVGNTGATTVTGDIASNFGAIAGFDSATVVGNIYTAGSAGVTPDTKELKQRLKLEAAATKRAAGGDTTKPAYRRLNVLDIDLLPTKYADNMLVDNIAPLQRGRPWTTSFTFYEAFGTTLAIETTQYVNANTIYAESSTYDVPDYQNARVVVNGIEVVNTASRGHTLVVLDPDGGIVTVGTQYDTWDTGGAPGARPALVSALGAVASGNIVVLVTYDASGLNAGIRSAINAGYGSTNTDTWESQRQSHIFIGKKI